MLRVVLGFLLCALAYPIVIIASGSSGALGGAGYVAVFTVGITVVVAWPLYAWYLKKRWFKLWQSLIGGAFAGLLASVPFAFAGSWYIAWFFASVFGGIGAAHALVFWLVAIWRNGELPRMAEKHGARSGATKSAA